MTYYAGVDLGASTLGGVVTDGDVRTVARVERPTPRGSDGGAVEAALCDLLRSVCTEAGIGPSELAAAAVASFGPLDLAAGTVEDPANLPEVSRIRLREPVAEELGGGPVSVLNDATAGVIGERFFADPSPDDVVYLTLSSGVGAGVAVDGHVLSGRDGNAGEVGHVVLDPDGRRTCGCGREGHWEAYCSGENIPDYARHLQAADPLDTRLALGDPDLSAADVFDRAGEDPLADRVIQRVGRWNAIGVANLVHAYAPEVVAVGGGLATNNPGLVVEPIRERVGELVLTPAPEVRPATLGDDAVVLGAAAGAIAGEP